MLQDFWFRALYSPATRKNGTGNNTWGVLKIKGPFLVLDYYGT